MNEQTGTPGPSEFGALRRELVRLCAAGAHIDAFLALEEADLALEETTGLWEYLDRQLTQIGERKLAEAARARLAMAGAYTAQMAIADAQSSLDRGETGLAIRILRSSFGAADMPPTAAKIMGQALATTGEREAITQFAATGDMDPDAALAEIDLLRNADRLQEAERRCRHYVQRHSGDNRFLVRLARIAAGLMNWDEALEIWETLDRRPGFPRATSLANRIQLLTRRGMRTETEALMADFLLESPAPSDVVQTARVVGLNDLADATVARAAEQQKASPLPKREWDTLCQDRLDGGQLGQVAWLAIERLPVGPAATEALAAARRLQINDVDDVCTQEDGQKLTSPECLLPFPPFIRMRRNSANQTLENARLLIVNASLVSGGAERQFVSLVQALLRQGVPPDQLDLAFFSLAQDRGRAHFRALLEGTGVRIHDLQALSGKYERMERDLEDRCKLLPKPLRGDVVALHHIIRQVQPTVLHGWQDRAALSCGFTGAHMGVERIVMSARNMQPHRREAVSNMESRALYAALAELPNAVLTANSVAGARDYENWLDLPRHSVRLLRNGFDMARMRRSVNEPDRAPVKHRQSINVTGVFRLAHNKRPWLWLETIAQLRAISNYRIHPRIVGVGPLAQDVEAYARELGLDDLEMEGELVSPEDIYRDADVVLLMSRVEGTPNVLLEAQALGIAVAACDVGGVREAILNSGDSAGLILEPEVTAAEAAARIDAWLQSALNAAPGARQDFIRGQFSLEALGTSVLELYQIERQSGH